MAIQNLQRSFLLATILPWILTSCATAYPKVGCGALGQAQCLKLQSTAAQFPTRMNAVVARGEESSINPGVLFWVAEDYDFSRVQRISIPDFRDMTVKNADDSRALLDNLAQRLREKGVFTAVSREKSSEADAILECAITRNEDRSNAIVGGYDRFEVECEVTSRDQKIIAALAATVHRVQTGFLQGGLVGMAIGALNSSADKQMTAGLSEAVEMMKKNVKSQFVSIAP